MKINAATGKIIVDASEATSVPHIYAVGDITEVAVYINCLTITGNLISFLINNQCPFVALL